MGSLERLGIPVIQAIASGMPRGAWEGSRRGLNALDTAVNVAIPEFDGRIISVPISFKERGATGAESLYVAHQERAERVAGIAARLAGLRRTANRDRRVAFVLTNSAAKASQVGGAVGLDSPASLLTTLHALKSRRYTIDGLAGNLRRADATLARQGNLRRSLSARSRAGGAILAIRLSQDIFDVS